MPIKLTKAYPLKHFETKRISADLDKLYRMSLLKRKSIARRYQNSRNGAIFGRGRKYIYNFTRQGWKYAIYLVENYKLPAEERPHKFGNRPPDIIDILLESRLPEEKRDLARFLHIYETGEEQERPVFKRFPRRYGEKLMDELLLAYTLLIRERKKSNQLFGLSNQVLGFAKDQMEKSSVISHSSKTQSPSGLQSLDNARKYYLDHHLDPPILLSTLLAETSPIGTISLQSLLGRIITYLTALGLR